MSDHAHHPIFTGQAPEMDIDELCAPTMVRIIVTPSPASSKTTIQQRQTFSVARELICSRSRYFSALFRGNHLEACTCLATLYETPIWAFKTFVAWLYTGRLALAACDHAHVMQGGQADDPTSWPYVTLFQLYALADMYDTRALRNLVIQHVQNRLRAGRAVRRAMSYDEYSARVQCVTQGTAEPVFLSLSDVEFLLMHFPASSPLSRCVWDTLGSSFETANEYRVSYLKHLGDCALGSQKSWDVHFTLEVTRAIAPAFHRWCQVRLCRHCGIDACLSETKTPCAKHDPLETWDVRYTLAAECLFHEHANQAERDVCAANQARVSR